MRNYLIGLFVMVGIVTAQVTAGNAQFFPSFGNNNPGAAIVGNMMGIAMSAIIQQLSADERAKRQAALQRAARSGDADWSSSGKSGKKARYRKVGEAKNSNGKTCQNVEETIVMPDGKEGKSTEKVCF